MLIISKALLFLSFFHLVTASGYLEMSFKSDFHLKAVINITTADTPLLIPFTVSPNETETLPRIPINFVGIEEYRLTIFVINEDKQDVDNITITSQFVPKRRIISPLTVMFPFTGVKINVNCDEQWYGEKCDRFCCSETAARVGKVCNSLGQLGCPKGTRGLSCEKVISKSWCKCKNGGLCISSFGKNLAEKVQCECSVGFTGTHCEEEIEAVEMISTYGVNPTKFRIETAKMLYESVLDNEFVEVDRPHSSHLLHNLRINDA